jgi:hypothetical protein
MIDWVDTFLPSVLALFNGGTSHIYNPPWVLFPLIPFAMLPEPFGTGLMLLCALTAFALIAYKLKAHPFIMGAFILSPLVFVSVAQNGNIEWLTILGLVSAPPISFLLLMLKPQMTICVIAFLLVELWRKGQRKTLAISLGTMVGALGLSVMFFGLWFLRLGEYTTFDTSTVNTSLFPYSVPFGIALFAASLRTRKIQFAIAASPMFFTVVTVQTWLVVFLALSTIPFAMLASVISAWVFTFYVRFNF